MVKVSAAFLAHGPDFSPSRVQQRTGIRFSRMNERGDVGTTGRYRGQPIPYGDGEIQLKDDLDLEVPDAEWLSVVAAVAPECRAAGAMSMQVHLDVAYGGQCNLALSAEVVSALAKAGVAITLSCYSDEQLV